MYLKEVFIIILPQGKKQLISEVLDYCYQGMMQSIKQRFKIESYEDTFVNMAKRLASSVENRSHFYSLTLSMCGIESVYLDKSVQQKAAAIYIEKSRKLISL